MNKRITKIVPPIELFIKTNKKNDLFTVDIYRREG